jgi:hypothetical protein
MTHDGRELRHNAHAPGWHVWLLCWTRRLHTAALAILLLGGIATSIQMIEPQQAQAGIRMTVCTQELELRDEPQGELIGIFHRGERMEVMKYSQGGEWAYGFAFGNVNRWGWVRTGWFC